MSEGTRLASVAGINVVRVCGSGRIAFGWRCLAICLALTIAACTSNPSANLENPQQFDLRAKKPGRVGTRREGAALNTNNGTGNQQLFPGDPKGMGENGSNAPPGVTESDGKFTINVDRADVAEASKLILGDTLGFNYVVDPRVQGTITLATSRSLSSGEVLDAFEAALRLNGATLIRTDGFAKVVALQEVIDGETGAADLDSGNTTPGYGVSAVPLRYISANNMMELMDSFIARGGSVRASKVGNLILVRGSAAERRTLVDVVLSFDVDWMENQSASISILSHSSPEEMVSKLEAVFAEDSSSSGRNGIKVVPLERLNGVVVIANSVEKVRRALTWVRRLDKSSVTETNYFVYAVQNGNAVELAKILSATFLEKSDGAGTSGDVAPDQPTVQVETQQQDSGNQDDAANQGNQDGKSDREDATSTDASPETTASVNPPSLSSGIRITPNAANNTIVIRASQREYRKILATLRKIDAPSVQVLINTTIMEVSLNDNLRYGVQAYLRGDDVSGGVFTGTGLTLRPSFPGMNFFIGSAADPRVVIDALNAVTKVRIVSSPSVLVLENETATIKVGDQVPVKTQTLDKGADGVTNSFEYRDTGVTLKVKPRVTATGVVTIELGQELSSVTAGSGSSTTERENPTFSQRSINSKVSVPSSQTVLLGGLISGQESRQKDGVPGVNRIPIIGDLIGKTDNSAKRNELIVFITPTIIEDGEDASRVSEELRQKMKSAGWN
jgi:general secretion pathway protein D